MGFSYPNGVAGVHIEPPGAGQMWSREKCEELAKEVVEQFDRALTGGAANFVCWFMLVGLNLAST